MDFFAVFLIFTTFTIFNFLTSFFAPHFIPYLGFFPYKEILANYHLPDFIAKFANFDGVHYLLISQQGYMQYEQAYFPLYPLLIKFLTPLFLGNTLLAGLIISNGSLLLAIWLLTKLLLNYEFRITDLKWTTLLLLLFPTAFFFNAVYTESLFFLFFIASLYFLNKKNYWLAGLCAFLASSTRLIGVFLFIPILLNLTSSLKIGNWKLKIIAIFSPVAGLSAYMLYLWSTVKDPLYFLTSQPIFGAHRSTSLILLPQVYWRYIKIFLTANHDFRYYISLFEFSVFTFIFVILILDLIENWKLKIKNYPRISLNLFSLANILLPTLTGTFSSVPRYALFSLSAFIYLGQLKQTWLKFLIATGFIILHILILGFFVQGYFIG